MEEAGGDARTCPADAARGPFPVPGSADAVYRVAAELAPVSLSAAGRVQGRADAEVCMLSYEVEGAASARPVCFVFNGGPGASSAFLNVGALGPRRVVFPERPGPLGQPVRLRDNPHSLLNDCDVVFVDPPGTGFSRLLTPTADEAFSVDGDAQLLVDAIRHWLDRHGRWSSPVHLCGESYGGARAAVVADAALEHGIAVAGLILVSPAIDMQPVSCTPGNDAAYALRLPAYAATAAFHAGPGAGSRDPVEAYRAAEAFARTTNVSTLRAESPAEGRDPRAEAAGRLAELIGVPAPFILDRNFLVDPNDFAAELLGGRRLVIGKMDSRVVGAASRLRVRDADDDVAIDAVYWPIATAMRILLREELAIAWPRSYEVFSHSAYGAWRWNRGGANGNQFSSTGADLSRAMRRNPSMRVWVCSGRYDLVTPTTSVDWSLDRLDVPDAARAAIHHEVLESGHMPYTSDAAHLQMMRSLGRWFAPASRSRIPEIE
jgi:carboxypeptidase C (cathepsin A)